MKDREQVLTLFKNFFETRNKSKARTISIAILSSLQDLTFFSLRSTKSKDAYKDDFDKYIYTLGLERNPNQHFAESIRDDVTLFLK